ncbi:hypothetical protein ACVBEG_13695 [Pseudomonas sp. GG8]
MTINISNEQTFDVSIFESFVGPLQSITHELTGPFPHVRKGKLYLEVAVEATILGAHSCLLMRFHVLQQKTLGTPSNSLKLRPADIEDEYESSRHGSISELFPDYHMAYKSRFSLNSVILAWLLLTDPQLQNRLMSTIH